MTVRDLIDTNQMITDVQITVRKDGTRLLDQLNIGCHEGIKPRFPTRVPKDEKYINNFSTLDSKMYKDAAYIPKSINAWDEDRIKSDMDERQNLTVNSIASDVSLLPSVTQKSAESEDKTE